MEDRIFKGNTKAIRLASDGIVIKAASWAHGFKGEKMVPFRSITTVQFKEPGWMTAGYIQFGILGGIESSGGLAAAVNDENSVLFDKAELEAFKQLRQIVEAHCGAVAQPTVAQSSVADELKKLAELLSQGVLTQAEFDAQKAKLLG
jgi:predicted Zn-dependent peptidase